MPRPAPPEISFLNRSPSIQDPGFISANSSPKRWNHSYLSDFRSISTSESLHSVWKLSQRSWSLREWGNMENVSLGKCKVIEKFLPRTHVTKHRRLPFEMFPVMNIIEGLWLSSGQAMIVALNFNVAPVGVGWSIDLFYCSIPILWSSYITIRSSKLIIHIKCGCHCRKRSLKRYA